MKNITFLLLSSFALASCGDHQKYNDKPGVVFATTTTTTTTNTTGSLTSLEIKLMAQGLSSKQVKAATKGINMILNHAKSHYPSDPVLVSYPKSCKELGFEIDMCNATLAVILN